MGRKSLHLALCFDLAMLMAAVSPAKTGAEGPIRVLVDGAPVSLTQTPTMIDGKVYVPARDLFAAMKADATETRQFGTKKLVASWEGITLEIRGDSREALVNGTVSDIGGMPKVIGGALFVPVRWLGETLGARVEWLGAARTVTLAFAKEELPRVGTFDHLKALMIEAVQRGFSGHGIMKTMRGASDAFLTFDGATADTNEMEAGAPSPGGDYSQTNVQVSGVDEADLVKTDGTYLYQVSGNRVIIIRAVPADAMELSAEIPFEDGFRPLELYAEEGRLIVIGMSAKDDFRAQPMETPTTSGTEKPAVSIYPPVAPMLYTTAAYVYDTSDVASPRLVRVLELEGDYLSSRKIGDNLYLISNKWMDTYRILESDALPDSAVPLAKDALFVPSADSPEEGDSVKPSDVPEGTDNVHVMEDDDTAAEGASGAEENPDGGGPFGDSGEYTPVPLDAIRYFPDFTDTNYLLIGSVNLADNAAMDVQVFLGAGQNVYASLDHLFITVNRYEKVQSPGANMSGVRILIPRMAETSTDIYKFALLPGRVEYQAKGNVPGSVLNQFSMDEYDGYFRIATTTGYTWGTGDQQSKNHLFVLDEHLEQVGKVTDIAPGEQIYSVRFMGKRAYMVTFRTVDPLFAVDLSNPASPKVLGALKIPGYSEYLHPYDENHLIGFGKDTTEVTWKNPDGSVAGTNAYYLGMKVALFDVTDVTHPIEQFVEYIGDRGTHSDLLTSHKALLFAKNKGNLLAFPVDLYEDLDHQSRKAPPNPEDNIPEYGVFTFQGAYVYRLDPERGFELRGRITHLDEDELLKAGQFWHNGDRFIRRILYIGDTLYTLSDTMVKANSLDDLREIGALNIPTGNN